MRMLEIAHRVCITSRVLELSRQRVAERELRRRVVLTEREIRYSYPRWIVVGRLPEYGRAACLQFLTIERDNRARAHVAHLVHERSQPVRPGRDQRNAL